MGSGLKIKMIMLEKNIKTKELAEKIGTSSANLSQKLSRDNLSEKDIIAIAEALNCDYEGIFTMRDTGKRL